MIHIPALCKYHLHRFHQIFLFKQSMVVVCSSQNPQYLSQVLYQRKYGCLRKTDCWNSNNNNKKKERCGILNWLAGRTWTATDIKEDRWMIIAHLTKERSSGVKIISYFDSRNRESRTLLDFLCRNADVEMKRNHILDISIGTNHLVPVWSESWIQYDAIGFWGQISFWHIMFGASASQAPHRASSNVIAP